MKREVNITSKYFLSKIALLFFLVFFTSGISAQQYKIDSLYRELKLTKEDSTKSLIFHELAVQYIGEAKLDSVIHYYHQALESVQKTRDHSLDFEIDQMANLEYFYNMTGNYSMSMQYAFKVLELSEPINDNWHTSHALRQIGRNYSGMQDYRKALVYFFKAKKVLERYESGLSAIMFIAETYFKMHMLDSALFYNQRAYNMADTALNGQYTKDYATRVFADIYSEKGDVQLAFKYYRQFVSDFDEYNLNNKEIAYAYFGMAALYRNTHQIDSFIFYTKKALVSAQKYNDQQSIFNFSNSLSQLYDSLGSEHEALVFHKISAIAKDSIAGIEKTKEIQNLTFNEQIREKENLEAAAKEAARLRIIIVISAIIVLIISFLLWNRIRQLRLKHKMILDQKEAEKLRTIDKMKERFFSNITHELRTPLSLILSPVELYLKHPEQLKDTPKLLKSIYENSSYLHALINQLLDISKLDAGRMTISFCRGDFGKYVEELLKSFEELAAKKQIHIHFENGLGEEYVFEPDHWKKIANNLLSNALKFTPSNGSIYVTLNKISESEGKANISFSVRDTGIGIAKAQLPFLTDRFYQADNSFTRKYEGAGIGLALVSELVKLMDGSLEIESEEGKGSVFTIKTTFDLAKEQDDYPRWVLSTSSLSSLRPEAGSQQINEQHGNKGPVILIAEDNAELRDFLHSIISPIYKTFTALDGEEGFQMALKLVPDIIISDVMMPKMDGFEFCNKIKNHPVTSHIAFIILSARTNTESKITGLQYGADDYLTKPFSVDELLSRINNLLKRQKQLREYNFKQLNSEDPLSGSNEIRDEFLQHIYKNIEANLDNAQLSAEFLADKLTFSEGTIDRKLLTVVGLSANELIRQYRLKKEDMQHQMLELESKALRAQMNPHFIFNCLNSIKSLVQQKKDDLAVNYLTTFSKLLRTVLQNSDKQEISLFDELETCRLYIQLESMRFGNKFNYQLFIDESIDLKSVQIPTLIIQPFIENAIWHGILPRENKGSMTVSIQKKEDTIFCMVDDDGIGRQVSMKNKHNRTQTDHQSKGVHLTESRLSLNNKLNQRQTTLEIIDKIDDQGKSAGTKVILTLKEY